MLAGVYQSQPSSTPPLDQLQPIAQDELETADQQGDTGGNCVTERSSKSNHHGQAAPFGHVANNAFVVDGEEEVNNNTKHGHNEHDIRNAVEQAEVASWLSNQRFHCAGNFVEHWNNGSDGERGSRIVTNPVGHRDTCYPRQRTIHVEVNQQAYGYRQ